LNKAILKSFTRKADKEMSLAYIILENIENKQIWEVTL